ncbi:DUF927 domain-containing protein [Bradyrhizobium sp. CCGB12]|uniref:DUF927 domain-containing protein n=1 Tax=Bradyrhizobium sp. CCGB12 TaxID=2949632 RepID=UPI0028116CBE|nr:DUF927 domain-containing protein [Bradyrhizobium sp. CCGB12]
MQSDAANDFGLIVQSRPHICGRIYRRCLKPSIQNVAQPLNEAVFGTVEVSVLRVCFDRGPPKRATVTTCCSFAAPLLRIANEQSFGFCLAGKTGGGKTTATLIGSSVGGAGQIDQLLTWNATLAGLEPALRSHNDCLMVVDDLNKMPVASEKEKYRSTNNFAHNLGTGSTKRRSPAFDEGSDNGEQYRVISLTSAETTIAELAAKCGEQRGGDARRLIDVPIYLDGLDHIFDRVPNAGQLGQSELQQLFSAVYTACAKDHGEIFAQYIRFLIRSRAELRNKIIRHVNRFRANAAGRADGIVYADIIRKFGIVYAGGALAIEGVDLPWKRAELLDAIAKCCDTALDTLSTEQRTLEAGWKLLKARLMSLPRASTIERSEYDSMEGYVEPERGRYRCIVKTDKFNRVFVNALQRKLVLDELARRNWITRSRSNEKQGQFIWPDGVRRRSLEINWARRMSSA